MFSFVILCAFLIILCVSDSIQQMIGFGSCPDFNSKMKNFDVAQYIGLWYEQYRYFLTPEIGNSCTQVNLTNSEDGTLLYQITYLNSWNDEYDTITGTAKFESPDAEGKFSLNFPSQSNFSIKYRVLDTDYESYSVVWSCENKRGYNLRNVWIFTREQHPSSETLQNAITVLKKHKLPTKFLMKSEQSNCNRPETEFEIEINPDAEYIDKVDVKKDAEEI